MGVPAARGTGLQNWRKLAVVCGVVILLAWGCTAALSSVSDFLYVGGADGQSVEFEFVDRPASAPSASHVIPDGDVILANRTEYGDSAIIDQGTWVIPLAGREVGDPVKVLNENAHSLSPGGLYVVAYNEASRAQEIIRIRDRRVVGEINAYGFIFLDDHRIVAFGSEDGYRFGEAKEIDLDRRTVRDIEAQGLTMSVSPRFVVDGEIGLCEEQELDGGSGPSCVSTRMLDPATGETRPLPDNPDPAVSDTGEYLFTDPWAWASRRVGDDVIYWIDEDDVTDHLGRFDSLRAGALSGPVPDSDRASAVAVHVTNRIYATTDNEWVVIDATPKEDGGGISVCDVATLDCSELAFASQPPYTAPEWSPIGVLPASAFGGA